MNKFKTYVALATMTILSSGSYLSAQEQEQKIEESVLGMNVSGTKDLPNVLYIIPWKPNSTQVSPPEISRLVDEIYEPVDPEVFTKQVNFYYQLTSDKSNKKGAKKAVQAQP